MTVAQAAKLPLVIAAVQQAVDDVNEHVSKAESIRKFVIVDSELSEASGHLTPSLKIKRNVVVTDFVAAIDEIYNR
jgi:long-chain acyl-CoA synthetase